MAPRTVPGVASQAAAAAAAAASPALQGPMFSKPLSTPDSVPMAGQLRAMGGAGLERLLRGTGFASAPGPADETAMVKASAPLTVTEVEDDVAVPPHTSF